MIISKKKYDRGNRWENLEYYLSRLSGPYYNKYYKVNSYWHRLYGASLDTYWDINNKDFEPFKEVSYDS